MVDVKALMQAAKNTTALSCEERMALYNSRRGDLIRVALVAGLNPTSHDTS